MADRTPRTRQYVDRDGVRTTEPAGIRAGVWLLVLAMALVGATLFVVVRPALQPAPTPESGAPPSDLAGGTRPRSTAAALNVTAATPAVFRPPRTVGGESRIAEKPLATPPQPPAEALPESGAPGEPDGEQTGDAPTGIAVFPPPGTKPVKRGIVVPDDFDLPAGYIRHYQTTDEGRQLAPILMFHPDYQPVDERGEPVPLPEDRVVPPEMAPPGLPVQVLEVPEPGEPVSEAPEPGKPMRNR